MRVLVTVGSGFIGTNLVEKYIDLGHKVLNLDIASPRNSTHAKYWTQSYILNMPRLQEILSTFKPEIVFHMAARTDLDGASRG